MLKITGKELGEILNISLKEFLSAVEHSKEGASSCGTDTLSPGDLGQTKSCMDLSFPHQNHDGKPHPF